MNRYPWLVSLGMAWLLLGVNGCRTDSASAGARQPDTATPVVETVAANIPEPVALAPLSARVWLVAERRSGRIRWLENGAVRAEPFASVAVPNPAGYHEYGLLGLAAHPDYPNPPYVYAFHTIAGSGGRAAGQRIVRFTVRDGKGVNPRTIVGNLPAGTSCCHNGGRIAFGPDKKLYVTLGDTQRQEQAQDYGALPGKILRYNSDGSIPADNPLEERSSRDQRDQPTGSRRTPVYAIGFRNPFGIAFHPDSGDLYVTDNGPTHGDELNRVIGGDNYGWPVVMGAADNPRFHPPVWSSGRSAIAPTGAAFYTGTDLPHYRGNLFFAAYNDGKLRRVVFTDPNHAGVTEVPEAGNRAKLAVAMGPDGFLYFTSTNAIYRLRARLP
ncbi:MAG: PQQ-dependent sugar dehydrogenase [Armatimonadota bacterium]